MKLSTDVLIYLSMAAAAISSVIYGVYSVVPGPVWVTNTLLPLWFTTFLFYFGCYNLYIQKKPQGDIIAYYPLQLFFSFATAFLSLFCFFCYAIGKRADPVPWSLLIAIISCLNVHQLMKRKSSAGAQISSQGGRDIEEEKKRSAVDLSDGNTTFFSNMKESKPKAYCCATGCHVCIQFCVIFFMILLAMGSYPYANLQVKFSPRGKFVQIETESGPQNIYLHCLGPETETRVFWMEADATHGAGDFLGLQQAFVAKGKRACVYDKAGQGWSDPYYPSQAKTMWTPENLNSVLIASGEVSTTRKVIFVAWGGGAGTVLDYTIKYPDNVYGLVFIAAAAPGVEFVTEQVIQGWTDDRTNEYRSLIMNLRLGACGIYTGLACPLGLMQFFYASDPSQYNPPEFFDEYKAFYLVDKMWPLQYWAVKGMGQITFAQEKAMPTEWSQKLSRTLPIIQLVNNAQFNAAEKCVKDKLDNNNCNRVTIADRVLLESYQQMANLTDNSSIVNVTTEGKLGMSFFMKFPAETVDAILPKFP